MIQLKDICDIYDCPHTTAKDEGKGYPLVRTPNVGKGRLLLNGIHKVSEEVYNIRNARAIPEEGDLILAREAPVGNVSLIMPGQRVCLGQRVVLLKPKRELVDPNYLTYYLLSAEVQHRLKNHANGAVVAHLNVSDIRDLLVTLPNLDEQVVIGKILSSIDDKIQLNQQINDNLEQQASSLLSDWISTYPCRTYKLSDICKYANAKCETGNLTPQNYISTENMLPNKKGIVEASNIPTGKATCFKVDDILIANIRPYFQKIWKADINGGCSADVLCIRANIESHSPILYWLLHQDAFFEYVMTGAKGCKMPRGDKQHIMNWSIDLPEVQYWADLATQLGSIDQQIAYNRIESINLSNLRDTLLPKLMSGEIKINEIDC